MTEQLRGALANKCILFVDDHRITIEFYREELYRYGATTISASNLEEGVSCLQANQTISWAVIDLHFPDLPKVLQPYADKLKTSSLNLGQTLGLYIREKYPAIGYCYLSVVPHCYCYNATVHEFGGNHDRYVLNKNTIPYNEFPQKLVDMWT